MKSIESFKDCKLEINALSKVNGASLDTNCTVFEEEVVDGDHFIYGDDYDDDGNLIGCWVELIDGSGTGRIYLDKC